MKHIYREKKFPIEAIQWDGENSKEITDFVDAMNVKQMGDVLIFSTKHSSFTLNKGDYVVKQENSIWHSPKAYFESHFEKEGE